MDAHISTVVRKNHVVVNRQTGDPPIVVKHKQENQIVVVKKGEPEKKQKVTSVQPQPNQQGQLVQRGTQPHWKEQGWKENFWKGLFSSAKRYSGSYKTPYASFEGEIVGDEYFIYHPTPEILAGPHGVCFTPVPTAIGSEKYKIHFSPHPPDCSSGIATVERNIVESYTQIKERRYHEPTRSI
jgi:hypothetical protein